MNGSIQAILTLLKYLNQLPSTSEFVSYIWIIDIVKGAFQQFVYSAERSFGHS
jgi:hypothetical protein